MRVTEYPPQEPLSAIGAVYGQSCEAQSEGIAFEEFRYGDDPYQSVAVYAAAKPNGILLAFAHGGGWTSGYKEWMGFMAPVLNEAGFTFASVGYRLAPRHLFPAGYNDFVSAVAALANRSGSFGYDPNKIFVGGHSAGGHYAALLAVKRDWQRAAGLDRDVIKGCLPISGVFRFGTGSGLSTRPRFLGPVEESVEQDASPIQQISDRPVPFLIAHGDRDFPHLMSQAEDMERDLKTSGGDVQRLVLPDCDHFAASLIAGAGDGAWAPAAIRWMTERVK
jgi:arylformamidase